MTVCLQTLLFVFVATRELLLRGNVKEYKRRYVVFGACASFDFG